MLKISLLIVIALMAGPSGLQAQDVYSYAAPKMHEPKMSHPGADPKFTRFPDGRTFNDLGLSLVKGRGERWTSLEQSAYERVKRRPESEVQWTFLDLDEKKILSQSRATSKRIFGASSSKIFVVGALLDRQKGKLLGDDLELMGAVFSRSDNSAWITLQGRVGTKNGTPDMNRGRVRVVDFTEKMGYANTRGFQGSILVNTEELRRRFGNVSSYHGNELNAAEAAQFLQDTYNGKYPGAEILWKLMYACRTGARKGDKYLPSSIFIGGKTGTYAGPTEVNGLNQDVNINNHVMVMHINGKQYGLAVLSNTGTPETVALLAGGLVREFAGVR